MRTTSIGVRLVRGRPRARGAAVGLAVLVTGFATGWTWSGPRIEIVKSEVDVGELVRGSTAEAEFRLRNTGDETLRILGAEPG